MQVPHEYFKTPSQAQHMLDKNLNYLRKKKKISQQKLADDLGTPRTTLGDYERGKTEPNLEMLVKMAEYFDLKIDALIREDLSHRDYEILRNRHFKVLAISTDHENRENIELVDTKAEAGYLESFSNPEYIRDLPKIYLPKIPEGTYRGFEIHGDSMLPMESGSVVICSYIEKLAQVKNDKTYVIVSKSDGLVYKRTYVNQETLSITAVSDNLVYPPYEIPFEEVAEIWQYYAHVSFSDAKNQMETTIEHRLIEMHKDIKDIQEKI